MGDTGKREGTAHASFSLSLCVVRTLIIAPPPVPPLAALVGPFFLRIGSISSCT